MCAVTETRYRSPLDQTTLSPVLAALLVVTSSDIHQLTNALIWALLFFGLFPTTTVFFLHFSTTTFAMSKIDNSEQVKFLVACIKHASNGRVSFPERFFH